MSLTITKEDVGRLVVDGMGQVERIVKFRKDKKYPVVTEVTEADGRVVRIKYTAEGKFRDSLSGYAHLAAFVEEPGNEANYPQAGELTPPPIAFYSQLKKEINTVKERLPSCIGFNRIKVDEFGCLSLQEEYLQPDEAVKLAKAILEFYDEV